MSIKAVTPVAGASSPLHPDHSRWVKEKTLSLEAHHIQIAGGTFRDAETANTRNLERLAARQRLAKPKPAAKVNTAQREVTHADLKAAGVTKKVAKVAKVAAYKCKHCGLCRRCRRELRAATIMRRGKIEPKIGEFSNALVVLVLAHGMRQMYRDRGLEFPFNTLTGAMRDRAFVAAVERICDRSVLAMGAWL